MCVYAYVCLVVQRLSRVQLLESCGLQPARLLCPWNSPGKNTGVGSHSLLQGIFLIQGSNGGLLHCRQILYHLSHQEAPMCVYYNRNKRYVLICIFNWGGVR